MKKKGGFLFQLDFGIVLHAHAHANADTEADADADAHIPVILEKRYLVST